MDVYVRMTGATCVVTKPPSFLVVCLNGDIRLQGGSNEREGRVEVCNNQAWGTVCDDFWDTVDAGVACFQMGYTRTGILHCTQQLFVYQQ